MMWLCKPDSIFGWDFELIEKGQTIGSVSFDFWSEQGNISLRGKYYRVIKHGIGSGRWSLISNGDHIAEAQKPSMFGRAYRITYGTSGVRVEPEGVFSRSFSIETGNGTPGYVIPEHMFTRRAELRLAFGVPEAINAFAFWLVIIAWRRAAKAAAS